MSLPTWTRKSPRTASVAAAISALALMAAGSASFADDKARAHSQQGHGQHGYAQQLYGQQGHAVPQGHAAPQGFAATQQGYWSAPLANPYGHQGKAPAPQAFATTAGYPSAYAGYGAVAASGYAPAPSVGYGQPIVEGYPQVPHTGVPVPAGYGAQVGGFAPGYAIPGATNVPGYGADPYAAFPSYGYSPFGYAPAEPIYAPAERAGSSAPAPAAVKAAPVAAAPAPVASKSVAVEPANATTTSGYSYDASNSGTYVGSTTDLSRDPYTSIAAPAATPSYQTYTAPAAQTEQSYQAYTPNYTQYEQAAPAPTTYEAAPTQSYEAYQAAPAPTQSYETYQAAPAPTQSYETYQAAPAPVQNYEYSAPAPATGDYVNIGTSAAFAAPAPAPSYQNYVQPAAPRGGHMVQVAAFRDANRANTLVDKLRSAGEEAFAVEALVRGKTFYRVRVAGGSKGAARQTRNRVRNLGYYEATIVKG